jgi:hypothetical protein
MANLHVFIDTNIWLSFYAFTNDDLEELRKLVALIKKGNLKLHINGQVSDEFYRNRETKLKESIRDFSKTAIVKSMPRYMRDYPDAKNYENAVEHLEKIKDALVQRATEEAHTKELAADKLFADILAVANAGPIEPRLINTALDRRLKGNPPGKPNSLGDQIHWEYLLATVPDGSDLYLISKDGDFESVLEAGRANPFLVDEWLRQKNGALVLHTELRPFLNSKFPDIKLAVDVEKASAIERLLNSGAFSSTHTAIARLALFVDDLSWAEADKILDVGLENSQIRWIGTDSDVRTFYETIIEKFADKINDERMELLQAVFYMPNIVASFGDVDLDDDPPF